MFVSLYFSLVVSELYDNLAGRRLSHFKYKVIVKGLWVENAVFGQDLMVEVDAILVSVPSSKVDVKDHRQRLGHKYFVIIQLGNVDIQRLARVGFRGVESNTLFSPRGLHGILFFLLCVERRLSGTDIVFSMQKYISN